MLEEAECICGWKGNINVPEDQEYNLVWECPSCNSKQSRPGIKGQLKIVLPVIPDGIVSVVDSEYIFTGDKRG